MPMVPPPLGVSSSSEGQGQLTQGPGQNNLLMAAAIMHQQAKEQQPTMPEGQKLPAGSASGKAKGERSRIRHVVK